MPMHRLVLNQIKLNEPLLWDVYDSSEKLLLCKGFVIDRESQLETLLERGMFVDAETFKRTQEASRPIPQRYDPFWLWEDIQIKLAHQLRNPKAEDSFAFQIEGLVTLGQTLIERSPDLTLAAIMLMDIRKYPIVHSLHVAVLCELVARRLEWDITKRRSLMSAAMTMNIGMLQLQQVLCNQTTPLTPEQKGQINAHPEVGARVLAQAGVEDQLWIQAVREHHENLDGTGYPHKIALPCDVALLLRTADIFSAKVSPRAHRKPLMANQAARTLFLSEGTDARNPFPGILIKEIGIYPPGAFVKLANGENGVVYKRGANANTPIVYSLVNSNGMPLVDAIRRDTSLKQYEITAVLPRDKVIFNLNVEKIWGENA